MAEVVEAFRKVAAEGKRSADDTRNAYKALTQQFQDLGKFLIGGLGIVAVAEHLRGLFRSSIDTAEGLNRLSKQTGLSTDAIQAFQRAARETGLSSDDANKALERFTTATGRAEVGTGKSATALSQLGIKISDLAKLSPDQRLLLIATALSKITEESRRSAIEVAIFSKGGAQLDGALRALAKEGFAPFIDKLKELGVFLDSAAIASLVALKDKMRDLEDVQKGLASQFLVGLAPALGEIEKQFASAGTGADNMRKAGELIGTTFKTVIFVLEVAGRIVEAVFNIITGNIASFAKQLDDLAHLRVRQFAKDFVDGLKVIPTEAKKTFDDIVKGGADLFANVGDPIKLAEDKGGGKATPPPPDLKLGKAREDFLKAMLDKELKLFEAANRLELEEARAQYEAGEISTRQYYERRAALIKAATDKEIETLKKRFEVEQQRPVDLNDAAGAIEKQTRLYQIQAQIEEAAAKGRLEAAQNLREEERALEEAHQRQEGLQIKLLELEGKKTEAARLRLQLEVERAELEARQQGATPAQAAAIGAAAQRSGQAEIDYKAAAERAKADLSILESQKKAIQNEVNAGTKFQLTADQQILALERARLPVLEAEAAAMLKAARESGDEQQLATAIAFNEKVKEIKTSTDTAALAMKEMRAGVENAIGQGINTFLQSAIKNVHNLGAAFDAAAKQIFNDLIQLALKIEEEKFLKWIFSGFGGGEGGGAGGGLGALAGFSGGGAVGAATGGYVRGPGSSTSDSIPAYLSDREFVVAAHATERPGVLPFLEAINRGGSPVIAPKFAAGGIVGSIGSSRFRGDIPRQQAPAVQLKVHPEALHLTLRDWFEREIADIAAKR
jgi:hypothetical protein